MSVRSRPGRSRFVGVVSLVVCSVVATSEATSPTAPTDPEALERRLAELGRQEQSLERSLEQLEAELEMLEQRVVVRGRAYYRVARGNPGGDWFEHAIRLERLRRGLLTDMDRRKQLDAERRAQKQRLEGVRERRAPLAADSAHFEQVRQALLAQKERDEAFQRAFSESRGAPHTAIYSAGLGVDLGAGSEFAQMRGRLPFPLPGRAEVEQVRRRWADGTGLSMTAPPGTSVRAVFGGRVAFADEYADYGQTIILDHGDNYYTVSANLGGIEVRVGEDVTAGSRLGTLGAGAGGRGELYFEVRRGNDTLPPSEWFGI